MSKMPKVSVIVPVYNTGKYLKRCMEALVHQTLREIEILVINDGSTDSSREILKEYEEKYPAIVSVIDKENGGQATARNLGITLAKGEYIGFADSDDCVDITLFEKLYQAAVSQNADLAECTFRYLYEDEKGEKELAPRGHVRAYEDQRDMFIDPQVAPWNKLFRKEILVKYQIEFPTGVLYEDTAFYIKTIPHVQKSVFVEEPLVNYYLHAGSTMTKSANTERRVADIFPVLQDMIDYYKKYDLWDSYQAELEYFCTKILLCSSLSRIGRVKAGKLKRELVNQTFDFIHLYFPKYQANSYLTGKVGVYMKLVKRWNAGPIGTVLGKVMKG